MHVDQFGREHRYGPPAGWVEPAQLSLNAAKDWERIVARGFQFEPYEGSAQLGLRFVSGDCLYPLLIEGQHAILVRPFAVDESIVDGDLYVIQWTNQDEVEAYRDKTGKALPNGDIAKFLRYIGGEWYCQCKDSFARLDGEVTGKVVGTAVAQIANSAQIANLAVTESYDNVQASGPTAAAGTTQASTGAYTLPALAANCTIKVRVEYEAHGNSSGGGTDNAYYNVGGANIALSNQIRQTWFVIGGDNEGSQVTNVSSLSFTAGQTVTFGVTCTTGAGTGSRNIKNIRYWILILKK